jgi:hypothetical protein
VTPEQHHVCHDMNPPHPGPCRLCEIDRADAHAGGVRLVTADQGGSIPPAPTIQPGAGDSKP